jgi:hypothetical protein
MYGLGERVGRDVEDTTASEEPVFKAPGGA